MLGNSARHQIGGIGLLPGQVACGLGFLKWVQTVDPRISSNVTDQYVVRAGSGGPNVSTRSGSANRSRYDERAASEPGILKLSCCGKRGLKDHTRGLAPLWDSLMPVEMV